MGFSAFVGGIYHGFPEAGEQYRFLSWSLLSVSLIFAQLAAYQNIKNISLKLFFILKSVLLLFISIKTTSFGFMVIDMAISMLGFIVIGNLLFIKLLPVNISYGILISLTSAFFVVFKICISPEYINYNDIGHYISILSLFVISKGVHEDSLKYLSEKLTSKTN